MSIVILRTDSARAERSSSAADLAAGRSPVPSGGTRGSGDRTYSCSVNIERAAGALLILATGTIWSQG